MEPLILKINNFSGGISDDSRKLSASEFIITKHFDIFSQPNRLIPYRSLEVDTNDGSTATGMKQYKLKDFLYPTTSAKLYALGETPVGGYPKIVYKASAISGNYTLPASSEGDAPVWHDCFVEFKDYLWGFQGSKLWKWGLISGSPSITNNALTTATTITSVAQGVIAADANLYIPYNNTLIRIAPGLTITDAVISVPANLKITSIANYGNYLAIAAAPISDFNGVSKVFLWNLSSDLFTETISFGEGSLRVMDVVEGMIVGVSDRYLNNSIGAGIGSMIIQTYAGGVPQVVKEVFTQALNGLAMPLSKAIKNNRLFFSAKIMTNAAGTEYNEGVWSFGRKNINYPYTLTLDVIDENVSTSGIQAFNIAGNYFFIAHSGDGSVDKTNDALTFAFTSIYESLIHDFGDVSMEKKLESIKVSFRKLATGESLTVKMKMDDATSFTTVGTFNTVGAISNTFLEIESSNLAFPSGKELKIRLESTGGLEITGYELKATPMQTI